MVERGRLDAADAAFRDYGLTDALFPNLLVANLLLDARGRLRCAQGDYQQGLDDLLAVGERQAAWEISNPGVIPWRSSAALACAALGDRERAGELVDQELALARTPRARGIALRAAGLVSEGQDGVGLLRDSVATLETSGARLEYARALTDLGAALRRAGRRTEAREPLRVGLDVATECGASAIAARAREELVTAGARPRRARIAGAEALTASERRIATMAATGMTNREIAQALFITIKTVKAHLGHVFQKLDITTRAQLAAALTEPAAEPK
jgi:DNA-binding CsgD family transcriptional regulator